MWPMSFKVKGGLELKTDRRNVIISSLRFGGQERTYTANVRIRNVSSLPAIIVSSGHEFAVRSPSIKRAGSYDW